MAGLIPTMALARLNVVTTTADFMSIAKEIGGDRIDVVTLARPAEDPHFVDAKPSFITRLNRADALILGGAELEQGWLPPLLEGARNAKIIFGAPGHISCAGGLELLDVPGVLDRSQGDVHASGNPHFMMDPVNGRIVARRICEALSALDKSSSEYFQSNLNLFNAKLDEKLMEWQKKLAPHQGVHLVSYHNTWLYFARRFGILIDLFLEPKPGIPPTPAQLASVISRMNAENIHVILIEPHQNRKTAQMVAEKTGARVLDVAQFPGGIKGAPEDYIGFIDYLITVIAQALDEAGRNE